MGTVAMIETEEPQAIDVHTLRCRSAQPLLPQFVPLEEILPALWATVGLGVVDLMVVQPASNCHLMQPVAWRCLDLGLNPNDVRRRVWYHASRRRGKVSRSKLKHLSLESEGLQGMFQPAVL